MYNIEHTQQKLAKQLEKYILIIRKEFQGLIPTAIEDRLNSIKDYTKSIEIKDSQTISLFLSLPDYKIVLPTLAYYILEKFKELPNYGINPDHVPYQNNDLLENNNTFKDYINHAIISGLTPEKYYEENLLHEAMHFFGFDGVDAISEGITELRTRQLAQKYNLLTTGCAYPKEVKLARKLDDIFGEEICTKINLTSIPSKKEEIILTELGQEELKLYRDVRKLSNQEFIPYITTNYNGPNAPLKKEEKYQKIDYSKVYERIAIYEKRKMNSSLKEMKTMLNDYIPSTTPTETKGQNGKYKLIIFETNRKDGCMSKSKKFYPSNFTEQEIIERLNKVRENIGKKYNFNGNHILQPQQKDVEFVEDYPDGKYVKITKKHLMKEDFWEEQIICDILLMDTKFPNIAIGHRMADCPVIIAEDRKHQVVAVSHCGVRQINREVPKWTILALKKEANSNVKDIYVYIGSCIKKENYQYDRYPSWATKKELWEKCIKKQEDIYYIDLIQAITNQLNKEGIVNHHITISPIDTYSHKDYYSHTEEVKNPNCKKGQNFVGCIYQEKSEFK